MAIKVDKDSPHFINSSKNAIIAMNSRNIILPMLPAHKMCNLVILLSLKLEVVIWLTMILTLNVTIERCVLLGILLVVPLVLKPYRTLLPPPGTARPS